MSKNNIFLGDGHPVYAGDASDAIAKRGAVITFTHIPTGEVAAFKAFITEFRDNYNMRWNEETPYGRMDPIKTYQGTYREISLTWATPAASSYESYKNLQMLSKLLRMQYPVYRTGETGNRTLKAAPLMRIKFMNLIQDAANPEQGLVGTLQGFSYTPDVAEGFYDGDDGTIFQKGGRELLDAAFKNPSLYPRSFKVQCKFNVLHTHRLGYSEAEVFENTSMGDLKFAAGHQGTNFPYAIANTLGDGAPQSGAPQNTNSLATEGPDTSRQQVSEAEILAAHDAQQGKKFL